MSYWNLTNYTTANNFYEIAKVNNTLSGGIFGIMTLLTLWVILFMTIKRQGYPPKAALVGATFPCFVISLLMKTAGLLSDRYFYVVFIGLAVLGIALLIKRDSAGL